MTPFGSPRPPRFLPTPRHLWLASLGLLAAVRKRVRRAPAQSR